MCGQFFAALDVDKKKHTWLKGALSLSFYVTVAPSRCASVSLHLCPIAPLPHCTSPHCASISGAVSNMYIAKYEQQLKVRLTTCYCLQSSFTTPPLPHYLSRARNCSVLVVVVCSQLQCAGDYSVLLVITVCSCLSVPRSLFVPLNVPISGRDCQGQASIAYLSRDTGAHLAEMPTGQPNPCPASVRCDSSLCFSLRFYLTIPPSHCASVALRFCLTGLTARHTRGLQEGAEDQLHGNGVWPVCGGVYGIVRFTTLRQAWRMSRA